MRYLTILFSALFLSACAGNDNGTKQKPISRSESMSFNECLRVIQRTAENLGLAPKNIVETKDLRMVRFLTSEGSVLVTCSRPDQKMVITLSN